VQTLRVQKLAGRIFTTEVRGAYMPLSRNFSETVREQIDRSPVYRRELLKGAIECMHEGDLLTAKAVLRDYINGTIGFGSLAEALGRSPKSLMRMLSANGNPHMSNLFEVTGYLQKHEGVRVGITLHPLPKARKAA
jgi:DNA-binding phage protein